MKPLTLFQVFSKFYLLVANMYFLTWAAPSVCIVQLSVHICSHINTSSTAGQISTKLGTEHPWENYIIGISVLIQWDFPTKLTINRHSLNMVNFCGIWHVSPALSKYLLRYEHFNLQIQHQWGFPTYFKRTCDPCGEITPSRSRKFSSTANLTRSFLLFRPEYSRRRGW